MTRMILAVCAKTPINEQTNKLRLLYRVFPVQLLIIQLYKKCSFILEPEI
jgi:hypothetical protein